MITKASVLPVNGAPYTNESLQHAYESKTPVMLRLRPTGGEIFMLKVEVTSITVRSMFTRLEGKATYLGKRVKVVASIVPEDTDPRNCGYAEVTDHS